MIQAQDLDVASGRAFVACQVRRPHSSEERASAVANRRAGAAVMRWSGQVAARGVAEAVAASLIPELSVAMAGPCRCALIDS